MVCGSMMAPILVTNQTVGMQCSCGSSSSYGCKTGYCSANTCTAFVTKDGDCSNQGVCDPANRQYCELTTGKCTNLIAEGSSCSTAPQGCDPTKDYCSPSTMNCAALLADGTVCTTDGSPSCKSGNCDMNSYKCVPSSAPNICTGM
jgi:hypothetical protein